MKLGAKITGVQPVVGVQMVMKSFSKGVGRFFLLQKT